ncbi:VOC family protein [Pleionea sp. CnH1-48]|uniref:VOC family protein n=1 Tax=Pleionea sp. CnH1-48 TaxID=2954494 RepID=UPI0020976CF7|nr:VOC family protein [Pleionea sp. CnH1-48]MCO7223882.1 VOC family protein [Pleionea sp. CnH1-48]
MGKRDSYEPGVFCWPELCASDLDKAREFYGSLLQWQGVEMPSDAGVYVMLQREGLNVGAMYQRSEAQEEQGLPSNWISYASVENVDATVEQAVKLGATVVVPPTDAGDAGRMAQLDDPFGARFGVWQKNTMHGAELVNDPGSLCWNELAAKDAKAASEFYCQLFGWTAETNEMEMGPYTSFIHPNGGKMGGMLQMTEEWGDMPSHWMNYFTVEDCDAQCEKVKELGGKVCVGPFDIPEVGRFAVINDTNDAVFSLISLNQPEP